MSNESPALEFRGVGKSFFGIRVLHDISFAVRSGSILGLVGENGAGKSTLMNILAGIHVPDAGTMMRDGSSFEPRHPLDATRTGVAFIQQELNLFPNLSIAENLFLGGFPTNALRLLRRREMSQRAAVLLDRVGLTLSPETRVERLSAGEAQLVEIAKALCIDARVIIFDEPTTSLTLRESERLFALMHELRARGAALIFISHHLGDVLRLCDDIVVLRDGQHVTQGPRPEFDEGKLITAMVGRTLNQIFPPRTERLRGQPVLELSAVSQPAIVRNISFKLHEGEVVGLAGLMGSGRSELARIIFGLEPYAQGEIRCGGEIVKPAPRENVARGLAFLTENRREEGLCLAASIADNMALVSLRAHASQRLGWLRGGQLRLVLDRMREAVRLTPSASLDQPARTLSGGNQQKVVLAKWLLANPRVVILDEPTRGVDVGAKTELYRLIANLRAGGAAVLVISSELEELLGLCDRILVMNRGEIRDELTHAEFDRERILRAALHERAVESEASA